MSVVTVFLGTRAYPTEGTRTVVAGAQYKAGGGHEFILGHDYRDLWTTPITVEVLDMQKEAGGLTAAFRVGGQQTKGLALKGKDGKNYTFRGIEKDNTFLLEEDLRGTIVQKLIDDQAAAQHPGSELVAGGLVEAAGIPAPTWRLVVLPDDAALGEFQKVFAGALGYFAEYPSAVSATNPGFRGVTEIIDHLELYKRLEAGTDRADVRALLKARLVDIVMGDWDRHRKQWRWAKFPGSPLWQPIPEDRDQAFSRYEGVLLSIGRSRDARFQDFGPKYQKIGGLTWNGWEQDRRLFAGVERPVFDEEAAAVKAALTDDAIAKAVATLPAEWQKIDGPRLTAELKARRDALPEIAGKYYRHISDRVDVYMTNLSELVEAKRLPGGDVEVTVAPLSADGKTGEPFFHRVFHKSETDEVRFYELGGDDKTVVTGGKGPIHLRAIGGPGNDALDDSQGGGTELADSQGTNHVTKGPGTDEDTHTYVPPPPNKAAPWIPPRDFGSETWTVPWISYGSDLGFFLGWGIQSQNYRFRKDPFAAQHTVRAGWSFQESSGKLDYLGIFHRENRPSFFTLYTYLSGVDVLRYYGLGNSTANNGDNDFYKDEGRQILLYPAMAWPLGGKRAAIAFGPIVRYGENKEGNNTFVDQDRPYGFGKFGQAGVRAVLAYDGRDNVQFPHKGAVVAVRGTLWPEVWDAKSTFGSLDANANAYLSAGQVVTLAVRAGGEHAFGDYPYQDAAYLGGGGLPTKALEEPRSTLRGFRTRRFGGDSSLYGNSDLRLRLGRINLFVPCHVGIFGLYDVGRVYLKDSGEDNTWHTSYGGGIWLSFLNFRNTFSAYVAHSKEDDIFHIGGGFTF